MLTVIDFYNIMTQVILRIPFAFAIIFERIIIIANECSSSGIWLLGR